MNFVLEFTFLQDYSAIVDKIIEEKEKMDVKKISSLHPLNRHSGYDQSTEASSNVTIRIINSDSSHNLKYQKKTPSIMIKQGPYAVTKIATFLNPEDIALIDVCKDKVYGTIIYSDIQYLKNGQVIVIILNKVIWYAVHVFMQTHKGQPLFFHERQCGIYRSKPAKDYFIYLKKNFAEIKGHEATKYFKVRKTDSCINLTYVQGILFVGKPRCN